MSKYLWELPTIEEPGADEQNALVDEAIKIIQIGGDEMTEDELNARIVQLEAENERLCSLLHGFNSQLEIAIDLGSKRWQALNDIYLNGEKHNANWCKRKAQEGLGKINAA